MRFSSIVVAATAVLLFFLLGLVGGGGNTLDVAVIRFFQAWRAGHGVATTWVIWLTHAGGAPFLLAVTAAGAGLLLWRGLKARAAALILTVLGGRLGLELIKLLVDRPRPSFDAHPVAVLSQSFPSGHAGNSTITYLALALFVAPARWRGAALLLGIALALAIGATRPVLGVHWPSDVLGGWLYGALVVALGLWLSERARSGA